MHFLIFSKNAGEKSLAGDQKGLRSGGDGEHKGKGKRSERVGPFNGEVSRHPSKLSDYTRRRQSKKKQHEVRGGRRSI